MPSQPKDFFQSFRGRRYRVRFVSARRLAGRDGDCEQPTSPRPTIRLSRKLPDPEMMAIAIREGLHAGLWDIDEDAVDEIAEALASMLKQMGYRRTSPP